MVESKGVCKPIKDLDELFKYATITVDKSQFHNFKKNSISIYHQTYDCHDEGIILQPRTRIETDLVPKTLVCHDMKGGYLHDKYVHGCSQGNGYTFYRWDNIDIFIYFSHYFVTVPPIGWINLAHKHDVKILGTFITESRDGAKMCDRIFSNKQTWKQVADCLVNVCLLHKFDGWLLNIENPIKHTRELLEFIKYLRNELQSISLDFTLIWYDSVTKDGDLDWQNELNDFNMCYFNACDAIYLNYTWTVENLKISAHNAGKRLLDVYVGVDVFGRNCYGGGGFDSNVAAKEIRGCGMSMAIFAQGWTHESLFPQTLKDFYQIFLHKDNAFWLRLYAYLYTKPIDKEFVTTFYTGADRHNYNLNLQEIMLNVPVHSGQLYFKDLCENFCDCIQMYNYGCKPNRLSYIITDYTLINSRDYCHRLFSCDLHVENKLIVETDQKGHYQNLQSEAKIVACNSVRQEFRGIGKEWLIKQYVFVMKRPMKLLEIGIKLDGKPILLGGFSLKVEQDPRRSPCLSPRRSAI